MVRVGFVLRWAVGATFAAMLAFVVLLARSIG